MAYGECGYVYDLDGRWPVLPAGWSLGHVSGLAVDAWGHLLVFWRGDHPVAVFDRGGELVGTWGEGMFVNPHSIWVGSDGAVYCSDDGNQTVSKFSPEGELLLRIEPDSVTPALGRLTGVAVSASGDIYVGDVKHERVVVFSPEGKFLFSWGGPGEGSGEFHDPHFIWVDEADRVWVVDRVNGRVQQFDAKGNYFGEWIGLARPSAMCIGGDGNVYVSEAEGGTGVSVFGPGGELLVRWGGGEARAGEDIGFFKLHAIAVDSAGSIYTGENRPHVGSDGLPAVRKFCRRTSAGTPTGCS